MPKPMSMYMRQYLIAASIVGCMSAAAHAQGTAAGYPNKPVRILVSTGVGGAVELHTRIYATRLAENLGRPFIVEVRAGRETAWPIVSRATPDGYTLLAVAPEFTTVPALEQNLKIDPRRDFTPISSISQAPFFLTVTPNLAAKSIQQLIQLAKAEPGKLNFAGGLTGTGLHLVTLWFLSAADIKGTYVSYKAGSQSLTDLMAGRVDVTILSGNALPYVQSGKLRVLGTSPRRSPFLPEIPTIAEQGVPGFTASTFRGLVAPARTPPAIINKLAAEIAKIAQMPETVKSIGADGSTPITATPPEFRKFIAEEIARWRMIVETNQIKLEQ